ncbi:MAG TPA: helix-turn-helix domain-containing protein [Thermomicrobiales bacterium]|nr:helix-turn-helix domain-containing protein [Thermomicrobiales bacterium]
MLFPDYQRSVSDLLHRDHYTPDELARLLDVSPEVIRHEVRVGRLRAYMVDHRVIDIRRVDVVDWLDRRIDGDAPAGAREGDHAGRLIPRRR